MRVFVAGATGVIGQYLVPGLIVAGHEVTASTRSPLKANQLKGQGAMPVVVDGLDREAVLKAVTAAQPEVIVHQMTALTHLKSFRNLDKQFAVTNDLRSAGTVDERQMPVIDGGTGIWSFTEVTDAAAATMTAVTRGAPGLYNVAEGFTSGKAAHDDAA